MCKLFNKDVHRKQEVVQSQAPRSPHIIVIEDDDDNKEDTVVVLSDDEVASENKSGGVKESLVVQICGRKTVKTIKMKIKNMAKCSHASDKKRIRNQIKEEQDDTF